jgi:predicted TIM-barrel fold metal-dependent hydrolase
MGYIDADAHVIECMDTWSHLRADEQRYHPTVINLEAQPGKASWMKRFWLYDGVLIPRGLDAKPGTPSEAARDLSDVAERVSWMDKFGVETQVVIPSFFIGAEFKNPLAQVALARSYNRWMAERCARAPDRLKWSLVAPFLDINACLEELRWGARHGAVSVFFRALETCKLLSDPYFYPLYAEAEKLGLAIGIHIGNTQTEIYRQYGSVIFSVVTMAGAFVTLWVSEVPRRFPDLKFGFLEAGSEWLPYAFREISRGADVGMRKDVEMGRCPLAGSNFFIACTMDEDVPHVLRYAGPDNLVIGTDFGHEDLGSDLPAHRLFCQRTDVDAATLAKIADANGRRLYNLPPAKTVAQAAE